MNDYENTLLQGWEDVFKRSQLTMWILLSLKDGAKHMGEIKKFMEEATNNTMVADDKSMYRALRRYHDADLVGFTTEPGSGGPDRKMYSLTDMGETVLSAFLRRNITDVFYKPTIKSLIERTHHAS